MAGVGRRRRRTQGPCPNALFVRWVEEWRDEAREKGVKTQYTYAKVLEPFCLFMNVLVESHGVLIAYCTCIAGSGVIKEVPSAAAKWSGSEDT